MSTIFFNEVESIRIPPEVVNLSSFREWAQAETFPDKGRICYFTGEVWIDMSMEQIYTHNHVKQEIGRVLGNVVKEARLGEYSQDGVRLTNQHADLSVQPDGIYVSHASFASEQVQLVPGACNGYTELEGTPDMVLEVVSDSSDEKDSILLRDLYWQAGIAEYWLIDARESEPCYEILRHTTKGYVAVRRQQGWLKSTVFGRAFQLTVQVNAQNHPEYTLQVKPSSDGRASS